MLRRASHNLSRTIALPARGSRVRPLVTLHASAPLPPQIRNDSENAIGYGPRRRRYDGVQFSGLVRPQPLSTSAEETMEFQAETRQLLDIVTHSLYTDKEVFLRELVSNASDAMEKLRHLQVVGTMVTDDALPLEIVINTNAADKTLTIEDSGVGMTREELVANLGTIARSGSKAFMQELKDKGAAAGADVVSGIIGQFGVGFYSAFMVGDRVEVISKSAKAGGEGAVWSSDGSGRFSVRDLTPEDGATRGCKIVIHLRDGCEEYASKERVRHIIKKYSNFVGMPIKVDGEVVNTVEALWMRQPNEVDEEKYTEFYQFIAHALDAPIAHLHFRLDAPIELKALFFFPGSHSEKFGMGRMEPGVSLYSRKVLIEARSPDVLPEWLRFVKGVVDSEDLPLSISREKPQDTALLRRIGEVLTRKIIRFLQDMQRKDPDKYKNHFFKEFGVFLKEGVCQDYRHQADIAKLLYFESSSNEPGELTSLDEYVSRLEPGQQEIYYLCAPNRKLAEASPYFETFRKSGREVLFVYNAIDDFVMNNIKKYNDRTLTTAETEGLDLGGADSDAVAEANAEAAAAVAADEASGDTTAVAAAKRAAAAPRKLTAAEADELGLWLTSTALAGRVSNVRTTNRLSDSPAIVSSMESGALRRMLRYVEQANTGAEAAMPLQKLEINPAHPIVIGLHRLIAADAEMARAIAEQLFDNALVAAGLMEDSRVMLPRLNTLMQTVLEKSAAGAGGGGTTEAPAKPASVEDNGTRATSTLGGSI